MVKMTSLDEGKIKQSLSKVCTVYIFRVYTYIFNIIFNTYTLMIFIKCILSFSIKMLTSLRNMS